MPSTHNFQVISLGQAVEIVGLSGSVELAPQVGLADAIVDLTASGQTLRDNRLNVVAEVGRSTARLIANQASLKTRSDAMQEIVSRIRRTVDGGARRVLTSGGPPRGT